MVAVDRPQDGIINLTYITSSQDVYIGQIDANQQILKLRHGTPTGEHDGIPDVRWDNPSQRGVRDTCQAILALGGNQEDHLQCHAAADPVAQVNEVNQRKWLWTTGILAGNYTFAEVVAMAMKRRSFPIARWVGQKTGLSLGTLPGENPATLKQMGVHGLSTGIGMLGFGLGETVVGDALGLHPTYHDHERFALGALLGYGAYRGSAALFETRLLGGKGLAPTSFGASLLSAGLVDATIGQLFEEHSSARLAVQGAGFFLPQIYRTLMGTRTMAMSESRGISAVSRWGGRAVIASFLLDAGYMGLHHLNQSNVESGRENLLYERATAIQSQHQGFFASAFHGLAGLLMPAITQRYLVDGEYVDLARTQLQADASQLSSGLDSTLRHTLFFGASGEDLNPDFYRHLHWDFLRGSNELKDITLPDGRTLPVEMVAEQIASPDINQRFTRMQPEEQIRYIQRQYRGHHLSANDVRMILDQIGLTQVRRNLGDLQYVGSTQEQPLIAHFDQNGSLREGHEMSLAASLFPNQDMSEERILGLRRVALCVRILDMQAAGAAERSPLAALTQIAQGLGLADAQGNLIDGEETRLAREQFSSHAPISPLSAAPSGNSDADALRSIAEYGNPTHS